MKAWIILAVVAALSFGQAAFGQAGQQPSPTITNADVVEMHSAGFSAEVIVAKIRASHCDCDTTPAALAKLKSAGVSEQVILAMIGGQSSLSSVVGLEVPTNNPTKADRATLHFYRERALSASARKMPIYIDEIQVADLVNGRQFSMVIDAGKHVFRCRTKPEAIKLEIEPGKEYYLRAEFIQGFIGNRWRIVEMSKEQGEADVQRLKPLDVTDITPLARTPR